MTYFDAEHYYNNHGLYLRWFIENTDAHSSDHVLGDVLTAHANGQLALRDGLLTDFQQEADNYFHANGLPEGVA